MIASCLNLQQGELIDMCTHDNRRLSIKCNKLSEGVPCVDLLPRMRYMLRINQPLPLKACSMPAEVFFSGGLLIIPHADDDGMVTSVVAFNASEKAIRVVNGAPLIKVRETMPLCPPMEEDEEKPGATPSREKCITGARSDHCDLGVMRHLPPQHIETPAHL